MNKLWTAIAAAAIGIGALVSTPAQAVVASFGGGASGTDPLGHPWVATTTGPSVGSFGEPGFGLGTLSFNPLGFIGSGTNTSATSFSFVVLNGVSGTITNVNPNPPLSGLTTDTRFINLTKSEFWTPQVSQGGKQIDFSAPPGSTIAQGDTFFVNIIFSSPVDQTAFSFTGLWTEARLVPEPASLALLGAGLVGVGLARRRRT